MNKINEKNTIKKSSTRQLTRMRHAGSTPHHREQTRSKVVRIHNRSGRSIGSITINPTEPRLTLELQSSHPKDKYVFTTAREVLKRANYDVFKIPTLYNYIFDPRKSQRSRLSEHLQREENREREINRKRNKERIALKVSPDAKTAKQNIETLKTHADTVHIRMDSVSHSTYEQLIGLHISDPTALIEHLQKGIAFDAINEIQTKFTLPKDDISRLIHVPVRTLARRKKEGRLSSDESERLYSLAVMLEKSVKVLESTEASIKWLKSPKRAFNGKTPLEYSSTEIGINEVKNLLGRIDHGVF